MKRRKKNSVLKCLSVFSFVTLFAAVASSCGAATGKDKNSNRDPDAGDAGTIIYYPQPTPVPADVDVEIPVGTATPTPTPQPTEVPITRTCVSVEAEHLSIQRFESGNYYLLHDEQRVFNRGYETLEKAQDYAKFLIQAKAKFYCVQKRTDDVQFDYFIFEEGSDAIKTP